MGGPLAAARMRACLAAGSIAQADRRRDATFRSRARVKAKASAWVGLHMAGEWRFLPSMISAPRTKRSAKPRPLMPGPVDILPGQRATWMSGGLWP